MDKMDMPLRILLVEDSEHDRLSLRRIFKKTAVGWKITDMSRAEDALEKIRLEPYAFDVIVADQTLPGMKGLELCRILISEKIDLPLVLLTGTGSEEIAVEALKSGVDDYITKSTGVQMETIPYVLRDVMKRHDEKLAREKAEEDLKIAYEELAQKNERLEKFQKITLGRESRVMELKAEVNGLLERLGEPAKYKTAEMKKGE